MAGTEAPIYVVIAAHGGEGYSTGRDGGPANKGGPIVHETDIDTGSSLEKAKVRAGMLERQWGPCRIARLVFEDVDRSPL